jgi:hypothetical protein
MNQDQLIKKRYMASTTLNKSYNNRSVFDIWTKLHKEQKFDKIQGYLKEKLYKIKEAEAHSWRRTKDHSDSAVKRERPARLTFDI